MTSLYSLIANIVIPEQYIKRATPNKNRATLIVERLKKRAFLVNP
jgi:hypothetical protein